MELTDEDRLFIRKVLTNSPHKNIHVQTDMDLDEPMLKRSTLYLPLYDSYDYLFANIRGVEQFDCFNMDMDCEDWEGMFKGCKDLKVVIFPDVYTAYINAAQLFEGCPNLETLDLSSIVTEEFDAGYMVEENTKLTEVYMPSMVESSCCLPNKDIRIIMDRDKVYEHVLDAMVYGKAYGKGPTFVIPQKVFKQMRPGQYEHLGDRFTIEVV